MPIYPSAERLRWSVALMPTDRQECYHQPNPPVSDPRWEGLDECLPHGIVTHPSIPDPILYKHAAQNVGDSLGRMASAGFFSLGQSTDSLADSLATTGVVDWSGRMVRSTELADGSRMNIDRMGSGKHLRRCARASTLTVDGAPMASRPITFQRWHAASLAVALMSGHWVAPLASQWAECAALVTFLSGRKFMPRPLSPTTIIGATQRPLKRARRTGDQRAQRTDRQTIREATDLLRRWLADGLPQPKRGRPSDPIRVAREAHAAIIRSTAEALNDLPAIVEASFRKVTTQG